MIGVGQRMRRWWAENALSYETSDAITFRTSAMLPGERSDQITHRLQHPTAEQTEANQQSRTIQ